MNRLLRAVSARRVRVFTLAVVATLAFLILPSWNLWRVYEASDETSAREVLLQRLIGTVGHLDEVLTGSARLAAASGDPRWEERYRRFEPRLAAAIEEMTRLAGAGSEAARRTDAANRRLLAAEAEAFALVARGRREAATAVLFSEAYEQDKRAYADGLRTLAAMIDERIQHDAERIVRQIVGAGALTFLSAGALLLAWVGVVVLIWRHLAARERAEEERHYLEAQIQHMQKLESLGVMAGGIAHDFNNLLMPILGNVDLALADLPKDSPVRGRLERLRKAGKRLSELTGQLLAYSGKGGFEVRALDLSQLVEESRDLLEMSVSKGAVLRFELAPDLPVIEADAAQLRQVVMNLVVNASDALGEGGGTITVRTGVLRAERRDLAGAYVFDGPREGRYLALEISDSGCGMDAVTRRQIFDPFFTTKFTGRGLGLAVTLGIVRGHRGAIRVESEPDLGTTIQVLFPIGDRLAPSPAPRPEPVVAQRATGCVLVVDDEASVRDLTGEMLGRLGYTVIEACDGREGVEAFRKHAARIDLVLLDLTMPGLSGEQALAEIQRIRPDAKVVLTSGYNEDFVASRLRRPMAGFLEKPYFIEELGETLQRVLRGSD